VNILIEDLRLKSLANGALGNSRTAAIIRSRETKETRKTVRERCQWAGVLPLTFDFERVVVTITRVSPRALDGDNLQRACKAVRDGVADALGCDDRDKCIEWRYAQLKGPYAVLIAVDVKTHNCVCRECGRTL
jgi:hypothetical protein